MKNYLSFKYLIILVRGCILIFLAAATLLIITFTKSYSKENVFTINNVKVEGTLDLNFSREKYLNRAFLNSFKILMTKILLSRDVIKVSDTKLPQIKKLISSFQILEENYSKDIYEANIKILYNDVKVKKYLGKKNISFSEPEIISAVFYPVLFIDDEMQNLNDIFFYNHWTKVLINNEIINFILPLEDLEDVSEIVEMKNKIEELNVKNLTNKYNVENHVFALMEYQNNKLNIHLKTNFNNNKISKNISYKVKNLNDENFLNSILKDLKLKITDIWKEANLVDLSMPLSIKLKFQHSNLENLDVLRSTLQKIGIIDNYILEEFNINKSFFKIYYYGDPKKLKLELSKFGYQLVDVQGSWQLYLNE